MKELTPLQILLLSAVNMSALALSPVPGTSRWPDPRST